MARSKPASPVAPWRPNSEQLEAARRLTVPDVIRPGLDVLFVGINPGLYSAAVGHHFGRPGNRFWPALHAGGFTPRIFSPFEESLLFDLNLGITNLVDRASAQAGELSSEELVAGRRRLTRKVKRFGPRWVAMLGVTSYRTAFDQPKAALGPQPERIHNAGVWVLPNPSGINAHHQPADLARMFRAFHQAVYVHVE